MIIPPGGILRKHLLACAGLLASVPSSAVVPSTEVYHVSVGHGQGACVQGVCSQWRSDLWTSNPSSSETAMVTVALLPRDETSPSPATFSFSLAPGQAGQFPDIVEDRFDLGSGFGALRLTSDRSIEATGRIYDEDVQTNKGIGTAGQFFGSVAAAAGARRGAAAATSCTVVART